MSTRYQMIDFPFQETTETWVNTTEGAEFTGYHRDYVQKLARDNWKLPDKERLIRVRKRSRGYDIWLPDLLTYIKEHGYGPYPKRHGE